MGAAIGVGVSITFQYGNIGVTGGGKGPPDDDTTTTGDLEWGGMTFLIWGTTLLDWPGI